MNSNVSKKMCGRVRRRLAAELCAALFCICCMCALCACGGNALKTTEATPSTSSQAAVSVSPPTSSDAAGMMVTINVEASSVGYGTFANTTLYLSEGATAYDALCATGLPFSGSGDYVKSINGLSELDFGATSGWAYSVNGESPDVYSGSYMLSAGDDVHWYYVTSM